MLCTTKHWNSMETSVIIHLIDVYGTLMFQDIKA